jgi:hypothetical protein
MQGTFTLPTGTKVRAQSNRRFVLVYDHQGKAVIVKRSDSIDTLRKVKASQDFIIDTTTGKVL